MTKRRCRTISVLLTQEEFLRLDSYCKKSGHKKSTLIARLIREHLDKEHYSVQEPLSLSKDFAL